MWTKVERGIGYTALTIAVVISLTAGILINRTPAHAASGCQEVVAVIEQKGNVLATCPTGTYIEVLTMDDAEVVVCRCGKRREPIITDDVPQLVLPPPAQALPNPEPLLKDDGRGSIQL